MVLLEIPIQTFTAHAKAFLLEDKTQKVEWPAGAAAER